MAGEKAYLGDGVYVVVDHIGRLVLTTEDGVEVSNTIVLDRQVYEALTLYADPIFDGPALEEEGEG